MAKIKFSAYPAQPSSSGFSVIFHLDGKPDPMPPRVIEAKTTVEALTAFAAFKEDAKATGLPLACCMRLVEGRAPNGFKAAIDGFRFYQGVNV